ncbi:hypothetical protein [Brevibacillus sp. SAFN-007a]|uniref:hypothetical protein n=1 Tax=Brevibacillus sp. SAFN-007a TaxID=3436862 RepID=UPI003F820AF6
MKKSKLFALYIGYVIVAALVLDLVLYFEQVFMVEARQTFNHFPMILYSTLYPIFVGLLFGLPGFVQTCAAKGSWSFDWIKFIVFGIPTCMGSILALLYYSPAVDYLPALSFFYYGSTHSIICGIAFGYLLLSCWKKQAEQVDVSA